MTKLVRPLIAVLLGCTPALAAAAIVTTQTETLQGTVTPGNDENYCIVLFAANDIFTAAYLPVEQEYGASSFSVPVQVPISGPVTEVATVLGVYGGNGGVNDTPVSVVMNAADATIAAALSTANQESATTLAADEMVGPKTFASTFAGATEAAIFNDLETGAAANFSELEDFATTNESQFVTLSNGGGTGEVEAFSQPDPGAATFELVVPEPGSFWLLLTGVASLVGFAGWRRRC